MSLRHDPFVCEKAVELPLFALVPVLSQSLFTLMRSHLVAFFLFTVWHSRVI